MTSLPPLLSPPALTSSLFLSRHHFPRFPFLLPKPKPKTTKPSPNRRPAGAASNPSSYTLANLTHAAPLSLSLTLSVKTKPRGTPIIRISRKSFPPNHLDTPISSSFNEDILKHATGILPFNAMIFHDLGRLQIAYKRPIGEQDQQPRTTSTIKNTQQQAQTQTESRREEQKNEELLINTTKKHREIREELREASGRSRSSSSSARTGAPQAATSQGQEHPSTTATTAA